MINTILFIKNWIRNLTMKVWSKGGFHIVAGNFMTKFIAFFGSMVIVRLLTKEDFGKLSYLENLYSFVLIVAGLGLSNAILRYVVLEDSIDAKYSSYKYMIKTALLINVALIIIFSFINYIYPHGANYRDISWLLYIMLLMLPAQYYVDNSLKLRRAMFDNKMFAYLNFLYALIVILAKVTGAIVGSLATIIIIGVIVQFACALCINYINKRRFFRIAHDNGMGKEQRKIIMEYSVQYMITNGLWALFMVMDIFLLGRLLNDPTTLAEYKVAYVWPAQISIVCSAVGVFVSPYFVKNEDNYIWVKHNFLKVYSINLGIVIILGILLFIFAKPLIWIYAGSIYYSCIPLFRVILVVSVINNGLRFITANSLAAMGQVNKNLIVSMIGFTIQCVLNIFLIPKYGMFGPAYAGIVSYSFMAITLLLLFGKKYKLLSLKQSNC